VTYARVNGVWHYVYRPQAGQVASIPQGVQMVWSQRAELAVEQRHERRRRGRIARDY
jgi:hypothetical protein